MSFCFFALPSLGLLIISFFAGSFDFFRSFDFFGLFGSLVGFDFFELLPLLTLFMLFVDFADLLLTPDLFKLLLTLAVYDPLIID